MALFLGKKNTPTNVRLHVDFGGKVAEVETVMCGKTVVWQYRASVTAGGLPTAGAKGHWVRKGRDNIWVQHTRHPDGTVSTTTRGSVGYGEKQGAMVTSVPDSGATPANWSETYAIMRWIPA